MRTIRVLAVATLVLIGIYFVLRAVATNCTGTGCDIYIPVSLLVPLLVLALVAITGILATNRARGRTAWLAVLLVSTILGVLGPVAALVIFKDKPDTLVPVATALELLVPIFAIGYSVLEHAENRY
jgi:hypothetical protein